MQLISIRLHTLPVSRMSADGQLWVDGCFDRQYLAVVPLLEMTPFLDQGSDAGSNQLFVSRQPKSGANS